MKNILAFLSAIIRVVFPPPEDITPEQAQAMALAEIRREDFWG